MHCLVPLMTWLCLVRALPTIEDNNIPTEEEMDRELLVLGRGQPEVVSMLDLPTDQDSLNHLQAMFDPWQLFKLGHNPQAAHSGDFASTFPEIDARGFHESVFDNLGGYLPSWRGKRNPFGISARGFHDDVFAQDFGRFHTVKKRSLRPRRKRDTTAVLPAAPASQNKQNESVKAEKTAACQETSHQPVKRFSDQVRGAVPDAALSEGVVFLKRWLPYANIKTLRADKRISPQSNDIFTQGFGDFDTMRKRRPGGDFHGDTFTHGFGDFDTMRKRRPGGDFHGDTFTHGFGDFDTMRKRRPGGDFHGDTFTHGFGDFDTMRKRRPGGDFHGDTFTHGFGDFDTMRKRRPGGDFHGDTFTHGFGDFDTMRKRRPGGDFHGDTFTHGFGDFDTMRKRRPGGDFHGDTFTHGFGDFDTMRKRRPGGDFHGDTFTQGFGDFDTMRKRHLGAETFTQKLGDFDTMRQYNLPLLKPISIYSENEQRKPAAR